MITLEYIDNPTVPYIGPVRVLDLHDLHEELCIKGLPPTTDALEIHFSNRRTGTAVKTDAEKTASVSQRSVSGWGRSVFVKVILFLLY